MANSNETMRQVHEIYERLCITCAGVNRAWPAGVTAADEGAAGRRRSQNSASSTTLLIRSVRACRLTPYLSASIRSSVSSSMSTA